MSPGKKRLAAAAARAEAGGDEAHQRTLAKARASLEASRAVVTLLQNKRKALLEADGLPPTS
jgi:hypothetical protein